MEQPILESLHERLLNKTLEVRQAQQAYYAFRPQNEHDHDKKKRLLNASRQKERELDAILKDEQQRRQSLQKDLF